MATDSRFAVLDLGTNTFHLMLAEATVDGSWKSIRKYRKTVKLGEGGLHQNRIAEKPFELALTAMRGYAAIIKANKIKKVHAVATSGIRTTRNGRQLVDEIRRQTGIDVRVISGSEEAGLIHEGVCQTLSLSAETVLIMDIGGGSTEFILSRNKKILWKQSFPLGASRIKERFSPSDPLRTVERRLILSHMEEMLAPLAEEMSRHEVSRLVSASGSAESFARMIGHRVEGRDPLRGRRSYSFDRMQFAALHRELVSSTAEERQGMRGLASMRVDMIVVASLLTDHVIKRFRLREMSLSTYALKEGLAHRLVARGLV